jgi:hypothetical protein
MKICSNEIVCSLGRTIAALSARLCVSLVPVLKLTAKCWDPKTWPLSYTKFFFTQTPIFPMEEDAFLVQPNYMWEYPLVSASEENQSSFPFWGVFFLLFALPFRLHGTDIAMHPETSQSKVWYPYILRSCGVHYRNNFLSGIAEVSTRGSTC